MKILLAIIYVLVPASLAVYSFSRGAYGAYFGWGIFTGFIFLLSYPLAELTVYLSTPRQRAERRQVETKRLNAAVTRHQSVLLNKLAKAKKHNDYGAVIEDDTRMVLFEFYTQADIKPEDLPFETAMYLILTKVQKIQIRRLKSGFDVSQLPDNGHDFEHWVAENLRAYGWEVRVTQGSGDQGIDVIATFRGRTMGIQCKRYSGSVGNKAVQEAQAGKIFHGTDEAAVLTNARYTKSANALAASTGIYLLSQHDIPTLHERM